MALGRESVNGCAREEVYGTALEADESFFSLQQNFFFATFGAFSLGNFSFSPGGVSYWPVSTLATLQQSWLISACQAHRSSVLFSSAKTKNDASLYAAGMQQMADTYRCVQVHDPYQRLFKLTTGGAATAGTGGQHVSH